METTKQKIMSRKEFLSVLGGMALGAILLKFLDTKQVLSTVLTAKTTDAQGYGNSVYGGKRA